LNARVLTPYTVELCAVFEAVAGGLLAQKNGLRFINGFMKPEKGINNRGGHRLFVLQSAKRQSANFSNTAF
jgi:hypothetical protein